MTRDYPCIYGETIIQTAWEGFNVIDNIVVFYIFLYHSWLLAAMIGTIIGAGWRFYLCASFYQIGLEWSPSMVVGTSLFLLCVTPFLDLQLILSKKKVYINAAIIFGLATFPGGYFRCPNVWMVLCRSGARKTKVTINPGQGHGSMHGP